MYPAKTCLQVVWQHLGQRANRQPGRVGCQHRVRRNHRCNASVQVVLPVQTFSNGLDDQVTLTEESEVVVIISGLNRGGQFGQAQWRRAEFAQPSNGALRDGATGGRRSLSARLGPRLGPRLGRQIKQHRVNTRIGQMGRNLCPHDTRAEYRHAANEESLIDGIHSKISIVEQSAQGLNQNKSASSVIRQAAPARALTSSPAVSGNRRAK